MGIRVRYKISYILLRETRVKAERGAIRYDNKVNAREDKGILYECVKMIRSIRKIKIWVKMKKKYEIEVILW